MTKSEIRTRIQRHIDRSDTTTNTLIDEWLAEVIQKIEREYPLQYTKKSQTTTLTADTQTYTLPSDLIIQHPFEFLLVDLTDENTHQVLVNVLDKTYSSHFRTTDTAGSPNYWLIRGFANGFFEFDVYPVPEENRTARLGYGYYYTDVSSWADGDSNWLTGKYEDLVLSGILAKYYFLDGNDNDAGIASNVFDRELTKLKSDERKLKASKRRPRIKMLDDMPLAEEIKTRKYGR